jgi:hypothetical protein
MSSVAASTPPLHVLRGLLRRLRTPPLAKDLASSKKHAATQQIHRISPTATFILEQYRASATETDPTIQQKLRKMAVDAARLSESLKERKRLYDMDAGAEVQLTGQELTRRAAARAGLLPPTLEPNLDELNK